MSKINRVPQALQDLLGNTNQGENPAELLPAVRAGFDMFPFWSLERLRVQSNGGSNPSPIVPYAFTVPDDEAWMIRTMSAAVANIGAANLQIAFEFRILNVQNDAVPGTNTTVVAASPILDFTGSTGNRDLSYAHNFDPFLMLPPGTIIHFLPSFVENSAVGVAVVVGIVFYKFRV